MPNIFYNPTGSPQPLTKGISSVLKSEFALIGSGFDTLTTSLTYKASITGQAYSGTHNFTAAVVTIPAATSPNTPVTKGEFDTVTNSLGASSMWVSGATYAYGQLVWSPTNFQTYRKSTAASISSIDPILDESNWTKQGAGGAQDYVLQTLGVI